MTRLVAALQRRGTLLAWWSQHNLMWAWQVGQAKFRYWRDRR